MTSTTNPSGSTGLSATDVVESLTGYDEQKIEQHFGAAVESLGGAKFIRALLFGHFLHVGVEAKTAIKQVMAMTQAQVSEYFADEKEADDPDDPAAPPAPGAGAAPTTELGHAGDGIDPAPSGPPDVRGPGAPEDLPGLTGAAGGDGHPLLPRRPIGDSPQA